MSAERPYYHEFAWAYDLLQTDPVSPRIDFVERVLKNHGIGASSTVLDAGCGTGRYALELARRGYHVCGVDRSPELIAVATNRAPHTSVRPEFVSADLLAVTFARLFDAILSRGVLNDLVEESDRIAIFQQFGAWLRPGGIAILDVREWTRTVARYEKHPIHQRTVELPDGTLRFQSETVLDSESRQMHIRECFKITRGAIETSNVNDCTKTLSNCYLLRARSRFPEIVENIIKAEQRGEVLERGLVLAKQVLSSCGLCAHAVQAIIFQVAMPCSSTQSSILSPNSVQPAAFEKETTERTTEPRERRTVMKLRSERYRLYMPRRLFSSLN